jgi:hypothetical protein
MTVIPGSRLGVLEPMPGATKIWRFMSVAKYVSMLATGSLYFSQVKVLQRRDPYEGRFTKLNYDMAARVDARGTDEPPTFSDPARPGEQFVNATDVVNTDTLNSMERMAIHTHYANCWHANEHESAGLWSIYASESEGVAIASSVERLTHELDGLQETFFIRPIKYVGRANTVIHPLSSLATTFTKIKSFEHEQELRALLFGPARGGGSSIEEICEHSPAGVAVLCDLRRLIEGVYVAPFSPPWFLHMIEALNTKFGIPVKPQRSSLLDLN